MKKRLSVKEIFGVFLIIELIGTACTLIPYALFSVVLGAPAVFINSVILTLLYKRQK